MTSPYENLPRRQFWKAGVAESDPLLPRDYYTKKYEISRGDRIATAGSCFAQHISRHMAQRGYSVLDVERAPKSLPKGDWSRFGYGLYSARYGNVYTVRQLLQLVQEAAGLVNCPEPVWERAGRFYDSSRPAIEPIGLDTREEVLSHRKFHLAKVRELLTQCDVFVFTLGLTETWLSNESGWAFPTAPGTVAGEWDESRYRFHNFTFGEILSDFHSAREIIGSIRNGRELRFLLTVSPVPLTASYERQHVLLSTTYSKSVLRAVAGQLAQENDLVDYFPSYEIISSTWNRGVYYDGNCRTVTASGVASVMNTFFSQH
jgi:hypothetical protein